MFIGCLSLPAQDTIEAIPPASVNMNSLSCLLKKDYDPPSAAVKWQVWVYASLNDGAKWPSDRSTEKPGIKYAVHEPTDGGMSDAFKDCMKWRKKVQEHYGKKK